MNYLEVRQFYQISLNNGVYWFDLLKLTNFRKLAAILLFRIKIDQICAYT